MTRRHTKSDVWAELDATDDRVAAIERLLASGVETPGTIKLWAGPTAPSGYVFLDGSTYSRVQYQPLFQALGGASSVWGLPSVDTFNVPDMRGRAPVGVGTGAGLTTRTLGGTFGAEEHVLTTAQMPAHTHPPLSPATNFIGNGTTFFVQTTAGPLGPIATPASTGSTGGGASHPNVQPSTALNFIIKT